MTPRKSRLLRHALTAVRSLLALAVGFVGVQVVLYGTIMLVLPELLRGADFPTGGALVGLLTIEILAGAAGVFVAAMLAARAPAAHGWTLGMVIMAFNLWVVTRPDSAWPLVPAVLVVGAVPLQTWAAVALAKGLRRTWRSGQAGPGGPERGGAGATGSAAVVLLAAVTAFAFVLMAPRGSVAQGSGGYLLEASAPDSAGKDVLADSFGNVEAYLDSTDLAVRQHMEERGIPGVSLVILRDGQVVKKAAYGRASLELNVAATPETVFPYASIAKIFTGTAILQLVQAGRFSLDDGVADLLPDLPDAWRTVSVRQLLDHTSGLPDLNEGRAFRNPFLAPLESREQTLATLIQQPIQFAPGANFAYNQSNYLLLALLLERYDGRTIDEYVRQEFAVPLGLASLEYGDSRVVVPGRASWYSAFDFSSDPPQPSEPRPLWIEYPAWLHTAAGLNGTATDLGRFVAAVASNRLLAPELRRDMWTAARSAGGTMFQFEGSSTGSGLGWWVDGDPTHPWVGMGGGASGVVRHYVGEKLTIAVLTNLQGAQPEALLERIASLHLF